MLNRAFGYVFTCLRPEEHRAASDTAPCEQRQPSTQAEAAAARDDCQLHDGGYSGKGGAAPTSAGAAPAAAGVAASGAATAAAASTSAAAGGSGSSTTALPELPPDLQQQPAQEQPPEQQQLELLQHEQAEQPTQHLETYLQQSKTEIDPLWHAWIKAAQSAAQEEAEHGPHSVPPGAAPAPGLPHNAFHSGAPRPACEEERRSHVVKVTRVLDKLPKKELQSILQLVCNIFHVKTTLISVLEGSRFFEIDKAGNVAVLEGEFAWRWSFCAWTLATQRSQVMVVNDTLQDARFADNHYVRAAGVRCYAGCPLVSSSGHRLGTLCFADRVPRVFDSSSLQILMNLSELVTRELEHFSALQLQLEQIQEPQPQQVVPVLPQQLTASASGSLPSVGAGEHFLQQQPQQQAGAQLPMQPYQLLLRSIDCIESAVLMIDTSAQQWPVLHVSSGWQKLAQQLQAPAALTGLGPAPSGNSCASHLEHHHHHRHHQQQQQLAHVMPSPAAVAASHSSAGSSSGGVGASLWSLLDADCLSWTGQSSNSCARDQMQQQAANSQSFTVAGAKLSAALGGVAVQLVFRCAGFSTVQGAVSVCLPPATPDRSEVAAAAAALSSSCPTGHRVLPSLTPSHCLYFVTVRPVQQQQQLLLPEGGSRSSGYLISSSNSSRYLPWTPAGVSAAAGGGAAGGTAAGAGGAAGSVPEALGPSSSGAWPAAALDGGVAAAAPVVDVCSNPQCSASHDTCSSLTVAGWETEKDLSLADVLGTTAGAAARVPAAAGGQVGTADTANAAAATAAGGRGTVGLGTPAYETGMVYSSFQPGSAAPGSSSSAAAGSSSSAAPGSSSSAAAGAAAAGAGAVTPVGSAGSSGNAAYGAYLGTPSAVIVTPHSAATTGYGGFGRGVLSSGSVSSGASGFSTHSSNSGHQMSMLAGLVCEHIEGLALGGQVASGSYGRVFRGTYFGSKVAVKVLDGSDVLKRDAATGFSLEALLCSELKHPSIISTHTWAVVSGKGQLPARVQVWGRTLDGKPSSIKNRAAATAAAAAAAGATPAAAAAVEPSVRHAQGSAAVGVAAAGDEAWAPIKVLPAASAAAAKGTAAAGSASGTAQGASDTTASAEATHAAMPAALAAATTAAAAGQDSGPVLSSVSGGGGSGRGSNWADDACVDSDRLSAVMKGQTWLILEYADKGCLQDAVDQGWLRQGRSFVDSPINISAVLATAAEVASGMAYLHRAGVVHGDLSPYNVLLSSADPAATIGDRGFVAKVADFGLARVLHQGSSKVVTKTYGTLTHMSPETLEHGVVSKAADVYSFGVLLWQMVCGSRAWAGMSHAAIVHVLCIKRRGLKFPQDAPEAMVALGSACLDFDPAARPTFSDILEVLEPCQALLAQEH